MEDDYFTEMQGETVTVQPTTAQTPQDSNEDAFDFEDNSSTPFNYSQMIFR